MLQPLHRWIWSDPERRAYKLLRFGETETDGGRDLVRGSELLRELPASSKPGFQANWLAPSGHGVDDLSVDGRDEVLLAFLHLSEKAAASRFTVYRDVLQDDVPTCTVFEHILRDEVFHMNYALTQLARVSPQRHQRRVWRARLSRLWKAYLRLASALAGLIGGLVLTLQYFIVMPPFAWLAKRSERRETTGWTPVSPQRNGALDRQYRYEHSRNIRALSR